MLLTPDDLGRAVKETELQPRARQNVVLELGYFIGRVGRANVVCLYDESVELPSDYRGVEYIKVDAEGAWRLRHARELKEAQKCEDEIRPGGAFKRSMGAGLAFDPPADSQESSEDSVRFGGWPVAQAA